MNKLRYLGMSMILIFIIIVVVLNGIFLIKPYGRINEINPTFEWISPYNENRLLVDDDENFENPIVDVNVKGNKYTLTEKLKFGKYYWKVISGNKVSITGNFLLDSLIDIALSPTSNTTAPNIISVTGTLVDGNSLTVSGTNFGSHTLNTEFLGGVNGPLETMPNGTKLEHFQDPIDPNWSAEGWQAGTSTNDPAEPVVSDELVHSGQHALKHHTDPNNWISVAWYKTELDPDMPFQEFDKVFISSWIYFNPLGNDGTGTTQWKLMHVKHGYGTNEWEGEFFQNPYWDNTFQVYGGQPTFYAIDENRFSCTFPCPAGEISCKNCAYPGPPETSAVADQYFWCQIDSYGPSSMPPWEAFKWMRLDWYLQASSEFDTWDAKWHVRLTIPESNVSYLYRLEDFASHGSDPLLDTGETLATPFWDNVWDLVMWKNQVNLPGLKKSMQSIQR